MTPDLVLPVGALDRVVELRRIPTDGMRASPPDPDATSILVPCCNYAHYLGEALESALSQTVRPREILVLDDGSTDDTRSVAARYAPEVGYHHHTNRGLARTRNAGARLARGRYVVFLDADDQLAPNYLERCQQELCETPDATYVYTQVQYFGAREGVSTRPPYDLATLKRGNYIHSSALLPTDLVRRHPYSAAFGAGWEDWDFYLTLAEHGHRGHLVDEPLLRYRRHEQSMTASLAHDLVARQRLRFRIHLRHRRLFGARAVLEQGWRLVRLTVSRRAQP